MANNFNDLVAKILKPLPTPKTEPVVKESFDQFIAKVKKANGLQNN